MKYTQRDREIHQNFMENILKEINKRELPTYLKGGTALLLCHGLDRFSEDIDLNSEKKFNLESIIKLSAQKSGVEIKAIKTAKDSNTTHRYKVIYDDNKTLKIETSFRNKINESEVSIYNGIRAYRVEALIDMKLTAVYGRDKARDFHDIVFLADKYLSLFSDEQKKQFLELGNDIEKIFSFEKAYDEDYLLRDDFESDLILFEGILEGL
jgi:predicted nucleotidyltransferase component of viral defense system